MTTTNHPYIDFATKYADPTQDYLNAYMSIARLDDLIDDLEKVTELLEADCPDDQRWHPWHGAEIISFYSIGFVTCLEWHAKSRLIDLLTFDPSSLKIEDVRGTISDKLIVQMAAKQASVAQLVGASVKVGGIEKYLSILGRVFVALNMPFSVTEWLTGKADGATTCWIRAEQFEELKLLFDFRHQLVHEIGVATMGHSNIRDVWDPKEALRVGNLVASIIYGIEAAFSKYAARLFPNVLTEERWPISSVESLRDELDRLTQITDDGVDNTEWNEDRTAEAWTEARNAFSSYMKAEEKFIETAGMLHWRYFDARTPLHLKLIRYRIDFLHELMSHFYSETDDDPNAEDGEDVI